MLQRLRDAAGPFQARVRSESRAPFQARPAQQELPALNLFTADETSAWQSKGLLERELQFVVDILGEGDGECTAGVVDYAALSTQPLPSCSCIGCKLDQYALVVESVFDVEKMSGL